MKTSSENGSETRYDNAMTKIKKEQNDKRQSTKHYTENSRSSNTNPTKTWDEHPFGIFKLFLLNTLICLYS
jgi:hypothetical protein